MKERVPNFKPRDTRGQARRDNASDKRRGGGIADEFEALLLMREQPVADLKDDGERAVIATEAVAEKDGDKGFER